LSGYFSAFFDPLHEIHNLPFSLEIEKLLDPSRVNLVLAFFLRG
jgi:hypothetical protein